MEIIAITQKGVDKKENEDRIVIGKNIIAEGMFQTKVSDGIIAIADGVGGNNAGAIASHFVAKGLSDLNDFSFDKLEMINNELLNLSFSEEKYQKMATTLSGISFGKEDNYIFNIGNTRVYLLQGGKYLKQLTDDDTTVNYLITTGQITIEEGETFNRKNEITACFGGGSSNLFKMKYNEISHTISPFVITSDGIHDYLSIDQMEMIIAKLGITVQSCDSIISAARDNGSKDDVSIIMGHA